MSLPYPEKYGTSTAGWSGSDASHTRAVTEASNGTAQQRQTTVTGLLSVIGADGITVAELRDMEDLHHGQASSTLSTMHKRGVIDRLVEQRYRCHVYVLPGDVNGRETQPHGRTSAAVQTLNDEDEAAIKRVELLLAKRGDGVWMLFPNAAVLRLVEIARRNRG